jgi:hypothetical protein
MQVIRAFICPVPFWLITWITVLQVDPIRLNLTTLFLLGGFFVLCFFVGLLLPGLCLQTDAKWFLRPHFLHSFSKTGHSCLSLCFCLPQKPHALDLLSLRAAATLLNASELSVLLTVSWASTIVAALVAVKSIASYSLCLATGFAVSKTILDRIWSFRTFLLSFSQYPSEKPHLLARVLIFIDILYILIVR